VLGVKQIYKAVLDATKPKLLANCEQSGIKTRRKSSCARFVLNTRQVAHGSLLSFGAMKNIAATLLLCSVLFSCSTDFDLTAEYKETAIVYGLLNLSDTDHYVRIQKAFLDEQNALLLATNPDSIYYGNELQVRVIRTNNGVEDEVHVLERVNGDTLGLPKDEGIFANSPNILYRFSANLNPDRIYSLELLNTQTGNVVRSQTPVVDDFQMLFPLSGQSWNPMATIPLNVQWRSAMHGRVYDLVIRFYYREWPKDDISNVTQKSVDVLLAQNIVAPNTNGGVTMMQPLDGRGFFQALTFYIEENPLVERQVETNAFDFILYVGGEELYNYIRVNQAQLGIASQSSLSPYTNIENGLGIFSTRYYKMETAIHMHPNAIDSLACGSITEGLNFLDSQQQNFCVN
jgi:hypothetical protein